ncbi:MULTISPECIES: hypothetical protein [Heyndrickxia]|jgi:hypothetical protein|uniref:Uncharacterized protein n=2 Tax=Heyndrickxia TaxID=2837504 RepID=A0AAW7CG19_HEYCO|nr:MULTISPECIES: hypothetical protein [Heyndrickxia]AWP37907.1 hypothetical protein CYJ15_13415 [Heyndrickxia coagulans]KGT37250.1 hypothetical protein P421_16420 [Heyndrickxia coagulans P38]KYC65791.1 hypothetical protein B4100_2408 [Heyndrickxia coagulans]KYC88429.1 hypothetical protein B4096_2326 [Heyndrickxia coagulans]MDL5042424.1 hypothetical protein [Heyndrickxia coagulans]
MNERKLYKSPLSALLWSAAFPGFGQLYNGDYFIGFLLMLCTAVINFGSNLNMSVYVAFKGNFGMASERFHPEWGIFFLPFTASPCGKPLTSRYPLTGDWHHWG